MRKKLEEMKPPGVLHDPSHAMDVPDSVTGDFLMPYALCIRLGHPKGQGGCQSSVGQVCQRRY